MSGPPLPRIHECTKRPPSPAMAYFERIVVSISMDFYPNRDAGSGVSLENLHYARISVS